jgi:hypothetical protein
MQTMTTTRNPLIYINDDQWIKLVDLLTDNVLALNSRKLLKVEYQYTAGGHYPAVYFRLTTVLEDATDANPKTEVSGFVFGFNNDWDDDVYIHPLSSQGYWEEWLLENGITSVFNYHEVGLRKLIAFLDKELKIWTVSNEAKNHQFTSNVWRELISY